MIVKTRLTKKCRRGDSNPYLSRDFKSRWLYLLADDGISGPGVPRETPGYPLNKMRNAGKKRKAEVSIPNTPIRSIALFSRQARPPGQFTFQSVH